MRLMKSGPGFKSLKVIGPDDGWFPQKLKGVCLRPADLRVLVTENITQSHGREAPSLGLIREPRVLRAAERHGVLGKCFLGSWETISPWIRLHPGGATGRSESDWHFTGVYCSHPACQSKPLECFGCFFSGFATCVYGLLCHCFVTCHKSVFIQLCTS